MKVLIGTTNPSKADWLGGLIGAGTELLTLGDRRRTLRNGGDACRKCRN